MKRHYGAILNDRTQTQRRGSDSLVGSGPSPFARCHWCKAGEHTACKGWMYDRGSNSWGDCYCQAMDHGTIPPYVNRTEIAADEATETAYEKTIGLDE